MGISPDTRAELERLAGVAAIIVGTCDGDRVPEVTRAWGGHVVSGGEAIEVCIYVLSGRRTVSNLAQNDRAALTMTSATTYRSLQVKGHASVAPAGVDDMRRVAEHQQAFLEAVASIGLPREFAARLFEPEEQVSPEMITIRIAFDEVFDQTPGPGAGARL